MFLEFIRRGLLYMSSIFCLSVAVLFRRNIGIALLHNGIAAFIGILIFSSFTAGQDFHTHNPDITTYAFIFLGFWSYRMHQSKNSGELFLQHSKNSGHSYIYMLIRSRAHKFILYFVTERLIKTVEAFVIIFIAFKGLFSPEFCSFLVLCGFCLLFKDASPDHSIAGRIQ